MPPTNATFVATLMIFICSNSLVGVNCYSSDRLQQAVSRARLPGNPSHVTDARVALLSRVYLKPIKTE